VITLDQKLQYMHYGQVTFAVDERGEVGMLTRNIRIQASADAETLFSGGHVMAMAGSTMQVSGVEFFRMGQHENLARYPIHWHLVGDNDVEGLKFENAKPVYFPPTERRWSFSGEFGRFSGWNGAVFHDKDGSIAGVPDSYIVIHNGIADDDQACQIKPDWNAAVCKGDFGRMGITAGGGGGGARGGAAGPGAAGGRGRAGAPAAPGAAGGPGAAAGPGAAGGGGRAGGRGGFGGGAPQVVLSRNGRKFTVTGDTTVRGGTEIRAENEAPSLTISLRELDSGSWVIFELPGYSSAATGTAQTSIDALRSASSTSYYGGEGTLSVKLVSNGGGARPGAGGGTGGSIQVSR
jgi:hypothetical protein